MTFENLLKEEREHLDEIGLKAGIIGGGAIGAVLGGIFAGPLGALYGSQSGIIAGVVVSALTTLKDYLFKRDTRKTIKEMRLEVKKATKEMLSNKKVLMKKIKGEKDPRTRKR